MPKLKSLLLRGISTGVGAASEAMAERKERKAAKSPESSSSAAISTTPSQDRDEKDDDSSSSEDEIELAWELDEAAAQLTEQPPAYSETVVEDPETIARTFLSRHIRSPTSSPPYKPLSTPVILPQRRPKNRERGFVRAYPPMLGECAGIDEQMFLDFLEDFNKASKASPVYNVINLAAFAVGFATPIGQAVSIAITVANNTAKELHTRYKYNTFLDTINESVFKPRGLYCMIMTYKPDAGALIDMDITSTDQALAKITSEDKPEWRKKLSNIRLTSGVTKGEASLPEAAPLIYPAIDEAAESQSAEKQNVLKSSGQFMATYLDRRAQALYATTNSDSKLVVPESQRQFKSSIADPNHAIHSGTIMGLLTAGKFDPVRAKRSRKAQRRAARQGIQLTEEELQNAEMGRKMQPGRGGRQPKGVVIKTVKKAMQKNLLYLTIVNLPTESEMMEIRQELERYQSQSR